MLLRVLIVLTLWANVATGWEDFERKRYWGKGDLEECLFQMAFGRQKAARKWVESCDRVEPDAP